MGIMTTQRTLKVFMMPLASREVIPTLFMTWSWMMAKLVIAIETGKMSEWSTSVRLGIHPKPPVLRAKYSIWASETKKIYYVEPRTINASMSGWVYVPRVWTGIIMAMFLRATDMQTQRGIWPQRRMVALNEWQLSLWTRRFHCF